MIYISQEFYLWVIILLILYYLLPLKYRWLVLLTGSLGFFYWIDADGFGAFFAMIVLSYFMGLLLYRSCNTSAPQLQPRRQSGKQSSKYNVSKRSTKCKLCLLLCITVIAAPLLLTKNANFVLQKWFHAPEYFNWIVPVGIAFYTLQIISYLVDIYRGIIAPQHNFFRYALFVSFFPQIVQGPIPRYEQLGSQLYTGHQFDEKHFSKGLQLIIWGFFLKLMIADRAAIIVNTVFDQFPAYQGGYVFVAGVLYSIQLYTDFMACVAISQGTASLFGIELIDNFKHPYFSRSIREFWRRWHISLSSWLKDYIYIPLGGNRKGRLAKYTNLIITFAVSGLWHGTGYKYVFWGLIHAAYQIVGMLTAPFKCKLYSAAKITEDSFLKKVLQTIGTFFFVMIAWIIFRAKSLKTGMAMIMSMFTVYNPWVFFNGSLFDLGITLEECVLLAVSIFILFQVERMQKRICIRDWILEQHLIVRWSIYLGAICGICIFGAYGVGFDAQDFIYGGF